MRNDIIGLLAPFSASCLMIYASDIAEMKTCGYNSIMWNKTGENFDFNQKMYEYEDAEKYHPIMTVCSGFGLN